MAKEQSNDKKILHLRKQINDLDKDIFSLISKRAKLAQEIGKIKNTQSERIYHPDRENFILNSICDYNHKTKGILLDSSLKSIFSEIISACRSLERSNRITFLGPAGSFTHIATIKQFGSSANIYPQKNITKIFEDINREQADYGVVPIENSIEGVVNNTIDLLLNHELFINAELYTPIRLCVYSNKIKDFKKIKYLYSHPQPLAQARNWIERNFPNVILKETSSTSKAAEECVKQLQSACIGSSQLSKIYPQLILLDEKIEDQVDNTTRFIVIGRKLIKPQIPQSSKIQNDIITSLMITIKDQEGALYNILSIFAKQKINLINLVSRPSKKKVFDYLFYIEFIGKIDDKKTVAALNKINRFVIELKVLGCFPKGNFF